MKRRLSVLLSLPIAFCLNGFATGRGGSSYLYYQQTSCAFVDREPYGVVYNYDVATAMINSQLQAMYDNGQRRVKLPIYFGHGLSTGTVMDSTGGNLPQRFRDNLTNLLARIRQIGFEEIEIGFYSQGQNLIPNSLTDWSTWNEPLFDETYNLIVTLRPIVVNSGLLYRIDLMPEGIPTPYAANYAVWLQYVQKLWNYYVFQFRKEDTVGFSIIPLPEYLAQVPVVYGDSQYGNHGSPWVYDLHIYEDAYNNFLTAYQTLSAQGYNPGWIIGEAFYNDASAAADIQSAIQATNQTVFYVAQFPYSAAKACGPAVPDVGPPLVFDNWKAYGF
jgi:hypothetical protein